MAPNCVNHSEAFWRMLQWNKDLPQSVNALVQSFIHEHAKQHPESQAVCSWDGILTYAELDNYSSRLANLLNGKGVSPGLVVPVAFEKSRWAIVSALAVLKVGGAFLLLDTSQPIARLKTVIEQTGARLALSSSAFRSNCGQLVDDVFAVEFDTISALEASHSLPDVKSSAAAYYIFTSGSTGSPKGVIVEHTQLSTTALHCGRKMGYDEKPRVFQFASYAFDMCITDIFATLAHGGTVCIPSDWERNNDILGAMRRMEVSSARFTPSLVSNLTLEEAPTLKTLILGGESCPAVLAEYWAPKVRLILAYGPTEGCVVCIFSEASDHGCVPGEIGRPVTCEAWIVKPEDPNMLCEVGEAGELLIRGPNVARGYLNDQVKTDRQFVHDLAWMPNFNDARHRGYRTGDLAKYMDDGRLCWVGRVDNQVKIRGQRLELEEVEKYLHDCSNKLGIGLKHVVVDAVTLPGMASKQLVAFLCFKREEDVGYLDWDMEGSSVATPQTTPEEQARFLSIISKLETIMRSILPAYAIPSIWLPLREVPFTVSRKRDRNRLRSIIAPLSAKQLSVFLHPATSNVSNGSKAGLSENEKILQGLWATIFGMDRSSIEVNDNFFSIGGDSVLAIRLAASARSKCLDLSLQLIFQNPVLADMAKVMDKIAVKEEEKSIIPPFSLINSSWDIHQVRQEAASQCGVDDTSIEDVYPCSPMQEGLMALSSKDAGTYVLRFVFHMPIDIDLEKLHAAWETVSKRTPVLRTRFVDYNADLLQAAIQEPLDWKVIEKDLDMFQDEDQDNDNVLGKRMSRHTVLRQSGSKEPILVWTIHHALVDGWAESNITTAVEEEYRGNLSSLSNMPMFNRFIKHLGEQDQNSAKAFWRKQLAGAPTARFPPLPHPTYIPKIKRSNKIAELTAEQGAELDHRIILTKGGSATAATMIQAAWFILVGLYSNSSDIITGVTLNGRTAQLPGIDQIAGPTISTVPFRAKIDRDQSVEEYLKYIQDKILSILPFAQFGLQNIRRLSEDAVSACKFRSLLLVQAANRPADSSRLILERSFAFPVMDFAIVMECELSKDGIDMRATFDHNILSQAQVHRMFLQMEDILQRIMSRTPAMKVADLQTISNADLSQVIQWNSEGRIQRYTSSYLQKLALQDAVDPKDFSSTHATRNGDLVQDFDTLAWVVHPDDLNILVPPGAIGELVLGIMNPRGSKLQYLGTVTDFPAWVQSLQPRSSVEYIKTGDLVVYDPDGSLNLVGRKVDHVQISGHPVDLSEIECRVQEVLPSAIAATIVLVDAKDGHGSKLVAYLGPSRDVQKSIPDSPLFDVDDLEKLRHIVDDAETKLRSILPSYMRPSEYFSVQAIPLTPMGEINREKLRDYDQCSAPIRPLNMDRISSLHKTRLPLTKMEKRIAELWKTLLDVDHIGGDDNFFQLGGGSVLAMRLVSMARREGLSMTVSGIFNTPTLREIASTVRQKTETADIAPFGLLSGLDIADLRHQAALQCQVEEKEIEDIYPCSFFQLHYVTGYPEARSDPRVDPWHWQSQGAYFLPPSIDLDRFRAVWNMAVQRHPILRTRLIHTPTGIFQTVIKASRPAKWNRGHNLNEYLLNDQVDYMTFGQDLLRLGIVQSHTSDDRFFVFTAQHVIYDAFMKSMLFKEVEAAYFDNFPDNPLPKMNKFVKYITETDKNAATRFWTTYLEGANTKPLLNTVENSGLLTVSEKRMTTQSAKSSDQSLTEVSLPTIIEVASALAIARTVDCSDVVFYSDRSGRNLPVEGIQDLIGPTTLFLPVRVHIDPKQEIHDLLLKSQRIKTSMIPHEHLGFLELREMDHLKSMLRQALNINITPKGIASSSKGWGLELISSHLTLCDDPFGINVNLHEETIDWLIYFDERFISGMQVERLLEDIKFVFFQLANAEKGALVAGILGARDTGTSHA
ncbi:hypothetical protein BKA64DRAFT_307400 [Cadophora sp. MPI-SDFR-AT-0126]|nr:hypothetical protein BKA64DRAFT_307400 [Leotiomycetes sp. MPI-SDFR-AT-0126]